MGVAERRKREFTYRGYTVEEMLAMPLYPPEDGSDQMAIISLMPARARRSLYRGLPRENEHFLARVEGSSEGDTIRTHRRDMPVLPIMVGRTIGIYNGREFVDVIIQPEMIGHYLGEYAMTRRRPVHTGPGVGATRSSKHVALK
jgi:small subunit ribosomal protein S19